MQVVDKGRAPGGRLATRRVLDGDADRPEHASISFDHGAQYFTVRDAAFAAEVEAWHKARVVQVWHGKLAAFDSEGREAVADDHTRWVGVPAMSAIARYLAHGLDVRCGARVETLGRDAGGADAPCRAYLTGGESLGPFDAVIVAVPAAQAMPLVATSPALTAVIGRVHMHPCWSALVAFDDRVQGAVRRRLRVVEPDRLDCPQSLQAPARPGGRLGAARSGGVERVASRAMRRLRWRRSC